MYARVIVDNKEYLYGMKTSTEKHDKECIQTQALKYTVQL